MKYYYLENWTHKKVIVAKFKASQITEKWVKKGLKKKPGGKEILMELGLMLVAAVLLIVFRENIKTIVSDIVTSVKGKIEGVFVNS